MVSKSKKEPTEPRWPQHKMGKNCGYSLHEDGSIQAAPGYADSFARLHESKRVVDELLASAMRACDQLMRPLVQQQDEAWKRMLDDYGLQIGDGWSFNHQTRMLTREKKEKV